MHDAAFSIGIADHIRSYRKQGDLDAGTPRYICSLNVS